MALRLVRPWIRLVAMTAVVMLSMAGVTVSGAAAGVSTGAATAKPVVGVSPSTGLVDLQTVTVTGSGFSANMQVGTVECRPGATAEPDCDLGTLVYAQTDQHGTFTLSRYVRRLISVAGKTIDCAATLGCILGAGNVANLTQSSGRDIFFNPKIAPTVPTITVSPNRLLVDHQLVTVSGKGYAPSTSVNVAECVSKPAGRKLQGCDYATERNVNVDPNGTFTATNIVLERRPVTFGPTRTTTVDCAVKPDTCDIQVTASGLGSSTPAKAPLAFNKYAPAAVAAVQLSPNAPLDDLEAVTLTGTGFTPGYDVNVQECLTAAKDTACDYTTTRSVTAGFQGQFTLTDFVRRDITTASSPAGPTTTDCATTACDFTVQGSPAQPAVTLPLTFDPNVAGIPATITASPNTGLTDNQTIAMSLNGYTPDQPVQINECFADALTQTNGLSDCDYTTAETITPTEPQTLQASFVVHAALGGQAGLQDCTTQPGACVLIASETNGYYGATGPTQPGIASTPLTFATP
ncbi:MAG: neocarzinostatin apoprotein domain-containing protein [Acidimicrobiia bacterium]